MPLFKPKTNKALIVDSQKSVTLDNKHNEIKNGRLYEND
jgi:hypothetical protein